MVTEAAKNPRLVELRLYWTGKRGDREMPARQDIDPADFKSLLPSVLLVDISYSPLRFRYRVFGTALVELYRREMTGKFVDAITSTGLRAVASAAYEEIVSSRAPVFNSLEFVVDDRRLRYDRVLMPLSNDGKTVSMVLGAIVRR